jgi:predicted dehydrogenase
MSKPIAAAIVGAGTASLVFHAPLILALPDLFTLHSVVERNPPRRRGMGWGMPESMRSTIGNKFNVSPKVYTSVDDLLKDPEVELVVVATPNSTHFPIAKAALEAGKHVIVDKPVTTSYADAVELSKLAKSRNLILTAFQNRRWDSDFLTVRKLISENTFGNLYDFVSHHESRGNTYRVVSREEEVGIIWDQGPHLIDQVVVLFGRPAKVTGFVQNLKSEGDGIAGNEYTVLLHYPRGTAGSVYPLTVTVRSQHPLLYALDDPPLRFIVRGDKGNFVKHGLDGQEEILKGKPSLITSAEYGVESKEIWGKLEKRLDLNSFAYPSKVESQPGKYLELYRTLAGTIRKGEPLEVKWDDAALNILLIELALQSSEQGRTIDVPQE